MQRVPITDLAKEVLYRLLGYTVKPVGTVVRFFHPPKPRTNVMPAPLVRVFYNATELAYVMGDREIAPIHLSFGVELDCRMMHTGTGA
jgi:hypothetical protein